MQSNPRLHAKKRHLNLLILLISLIYAFIFAGPVTILIFGLDSPIFTSSGTPDELLFDLIRLIILRFLNEINRKFEFPGKKKIHQILNDLVIGKPLNLSKSNYFSQYLTQFKFNYL
jgi:hypothetical protein